MVCANEHNEELQEEIKRTRLCISQSIVNGNKLLSSIFCLTKKDTNGSTNN